MPEGIVDCGTPNEKATRVAAVAVNDDNAGALPNANGACAADNEDDDGVLPNANAAGADAAADDDDGALPNENAAGADADDGAPPNENRAGAAVTAAAAADDDGVPPNENGAGAAAAVTAGDDDDGVPPNENGAGTAAAAAADGDDRSVPPNENRAGAAVTVADDDDGALPNKNGAGAAVTAADDDDGAPPNENGAGAAAAVTDDKDGAPPNENGAGAAAAVTDDDDGVIPNKNGAGVAAAVTDDDDGVLPNANTPCATGADDDDEVNEVSDVVLVGGVNEEGSGGTCCGLTLLLKAIPREESCGSDFFADPMGEGGGRPSMLGEAVPGDATLVLSTTAPGPALGAEEGRVLGVTASALCAGMCVEPSLLWATGPGTTIDVKAVSEALNGLIVLCPAGCNGASDDDVAVVAAVKATALVPILPFSGALKAAPKLACVLAPLPGSACVTATAL